MPDAGRIKGAGVIQALCWLEKHRGRDRLEAARPLMSAAVQADLNLDRSTYGIVASQWYPAADTHAVLDCMVKGLGPVERAEMARSLAKAVMEGTLRGVYGYLFSMMATPERYARRAPQLWANYYGDGMVCLTLPTPKTMVASISNWKGHHPFMCELVQFARVAALEAMGCMNVISQPDCKSIRGGDECIAHVRWG